MGWEIRATVAPKVGFASHQNAVPLIRELSVSSTAERLLEGAKLTLVADPPFVHQKSWFIDSISPGDTVHIPDRDVGFDATYLNGLTEGLMSLLVFTLTNRDGAAVAQFSKPVELLARNQWGGIGTMAELLPAFVMPNDPAVDRLLKVASEVLRRAGKRDALDGYSAGKRERPWELASAIWSAVSGLRLSYALPPASFGETGQKVRTPSQILDGRLATCLDTALLFAAALEQAGLNPLLVLTEGHAFAGVWLQPTQFANLLTDEAAALRRRLDLDDLLLFEATLATQNPPATFSQAIAAARREIADGSATPFEMAIDVRRARVQKIRPLSVPVPPAAATGDAATAAEALEPAPALPAFEIEVEEEAPTPVTRIRQWQRKLLNLTTSNRLLHLPDAAKVVRLVCATPAPLEALLAGGKKVRIEPMPDLEVGGRDEGLYEHRTRESLLLEVAESAMQRGEALSLLPKDRLDATLVDLYRKARTDMQEGGANTLYLALGFLKWKKSPDEQRAYCAPLILRPVHLERKSVLSGIRMSAHEDEPRFNPTLLELLRQDFALTIPSLNEELPQGQGGIDIAGIWRGVRAAVRDMVGFEVISEVVLGTFSFAKYLMWKDLVDRADRLKESALVRHLIDRDGSVPTDKGGFRRAGELDATMQPADVFTPLPADSSQLLAVLASTNEKDFVLNGPPGTGKSQTIANIIAHNLALGRRVLFVAEKRAALEVVQRRLAGKGLGPFCLELHSAKATKSAVLKQLDQAWTTRDMLSAEEWQGAASETKYLRDSLNAILSLLHRRERNGWSIHRAIGRTVRDATDFTPQLTFPSSVRHDASDMTHFRDIAHRLGMALAEVVDVLAELKDVRHTDWSNRWQAEIAAEAREIPALLAEIEQAYQALSAASRLPLPGNDERELHRLLEFVQLCLATHGFDLRFAFAPDFADHATAARKAVPLIERYQSEESLLSATYAPEAARRIDLDSMRAAWARANGKVWPFRTSAKRKVAAALKDTGNAAASVDPGADLPRLTALRDILQEIDPLARTAASVPGWAGAATDSRTLLDTIARAERLRTAITAAAATPDALLELRKTASFLVVEANEMLASDGPIAAAAGRLRRALERMSQAAERFGALGGQAGGADFTTLRVRAYSVARHNLRLRDWALWQGVRNEAITAGLTPLVDALEQKAIVPEASPDAFETGYARWFAATRMDEEPLLKTFMPRVHEEQIAAFRKLDDRMCELASRYIRAKLCGAIPEKAQAGKSDGYGTLRYQLHLQRPSMPIRKLAAEMGEAFTRLAPCMLMSPLSIAQYLPPDHALFDLVIFDEASQITPWDAIGAMARGKHVIVAGDPCQMPPSNDFARDTGAGTIDSDTEADMESVLEECLAAGVPELGLDWHYRSRHESLITFSNRNYYAGKLVTFPAPETRPSAVSWHRVDGVYARGASRTNVPEAEAIVEEAVRRLTDPLFVDTEGNPLSLGIITMNVEQMKLVEDLLDKAREAHPEIEPYFDTEQSLEPVCVRNLETAQGDERDLVLLGVGFGPTEPGGRTMSVDFGKLNRDGGWRRLNVAVTRARREMVVFTSFDPGMIDLHRTSQRAVVDLKHFIEFAGRGPRALAEAVKGSMGGADSPFEEAVAEELRQRGWIVVPQIGVSSFRIDLGIVHPDRPGDYLLGVECDGATYHSAATARDRDKIRASILKDLGWRLLRVWSTDWWFDKERAATRLHALIEEQLAADREAAKEPAAIRGGAPPCAGPRTPSATEADDTAPELPQPIYARAPKPVVEPPARPAGDRLYHVTNFTSLASTIDSGRFFEPGYDQTLRVLIAHVLTAEAPIAEALLVQRIARAHGFQRAGHLIRDRVMTLAERLHHIEEEEGGARFVWADAPQAESWRQARQPASEDDMRQIEEIALAELRAVATGGDPVSVARYFGVKRLSAAARARIEAA